MNKNQRCIFGLGEKGVRQCRNKVITDTEFCKVHSYLINGRGGADGENEKEVRNDPEDDKEKEFQERIRKVHEAARKKGKVGWRRYGNRVEQNEEEHTEDQDKQEVNFLS